jgi:tetratricopeptide (TPR) repeat protein
MAHVLEFALHGLDNKARQVLQTIAAFRMPASYDTLAALFVGGPHPNPLPLGEEPVLRPLRVSKDEGQEKLFPHEPGLDAALSDLEDRGLLGWDRRANRYDLHPLVRGVVWSGLPDQTRTLVFISLHTHFEAVPQIEDWEQVNSLEDLTPAIELYNVLIGLGRYEDAILLFYKRIDDATLYRLSAGRQRVELLELLFPDGVDPLPRLKEPARQAFTLNALAQAYQLSGQPGRAAPLYRRACTVYTEMKRDDYLSTSLRNLSNALRPAGALRESEAAARRALVITREQSNGISEAGSLGVLGLTLAAQGVARESKLALQRSLRIFVAQSHIQAEGVANVYLAQRAFWLGEPATVRAAAGRAWELAVQLGRNEGDFIRAARLQGAALVQTCEVSETSKVSAAKAEERLHHALSRARAVNFVEEELAALVALAELRRRQGQLQVARDLLVGVGEVAERGPYPLIHADACNVLAQIERDEGNQEKAVEAATQAYRLAWCDGPPFAYHWGLVTARQHLAALGAAEPSLPPFDESKHETMPEVEIDPKDEFHVGDVGQA